VKLSLGKDNPHEAPEEHFICPGETKGEEMNLVILGGGTGGTIAAWTFAQRGQRVAVIERKYIGGSCPNIACLPSQRTSFTARRLLRTFAEAKSSATPKEMSGNDSHIQTKEK
jgi:pyruvate/2-oxoglutarate dehydrogenase complex dihydrolipoamide dehydrogenase (E3) component